MTKFQKIIKLIAIGLAITITINIVSLVIYLLSIFINVNNDEKTTFNEVYNDVERIEIDGVSSSITIKTGNQFKVEAINIERGFTSKLKNKTLKIEENSSWLGINNGNGSIIITIPAGNILKELSIDTGAGKFIIDSIEAKEFDIDHGAGTLEITNSKFDKADIDGGAGAIAITNTNLNNLDLDSGIGTVEIEAFITGLSQISCGIGGIAVTLLGDESDYTIKTAKGIGSIKINNIEQSNDLVFGNGSNKLEIEGGIGNININFK